MQGLMKFHQGLIKILRKQNVTDERTDGRTDFLTNGIYEAMFSYFGYLCGYFPLRGLDTQKKNIATKISNLRNKSHLDTKMNTSVSNCPNL